LTVVVAESGPMLPVTDTVPTPRGDSKPVALWVMIKRADKMSALMILEFTSG
jgi:hypothetical protein